MIVRNERLVGLREAAARDAGEQGEIQPAEPLPLVRLPRSSPRKVAFSNVFVTRTCGHFVQLLRERQVEGEIVRRAFGS
jgi:hypothetical protein